MPRVRDESLSPPALGATRRDVLRGGLSSLGLWLASPALARARTRSGSARACILLWLDGGPSHLDTFDPKPEAPSEVRGPFRAIPTSLPGLQLSELFPHTAKIAHRLAVVRSMTSPLGEHDFASHYLLTGYKPTPAVVYPSLGSIVATTAAEDRVLPAYVGVGGAPNPRDGAGYLPARFAPFALGGDPGKSDFEVRDLELARGLTPRRLARRRRFQGALEGFRSGEGPGAGADPAFEQAYRLIASGSAREAFDLAAEDPARRARYGMTTVGQSCLLARRLVESGVPFVTVTDRGWDTHKDLRQRLEQGHTGGSVGKAANLDRALSALVEDLAASGLLDETLVLVLGEFGRTPKLNTDGGRDHWPRVFSAVLAGGGVPPGQVVGASDPVGESPAERPVTPADLACTVLTLLGVDPRHEFVTADGRPILANRDGEPVRELLG